MRQRAVTGGRHGEALLNLRIATIHGHQIHFKLYVYHWFNGTFKNSNGEAGAETETEADTEMHIQMLLLWIKLNYIQTKKLKSKQEAKPYRQIIFVEAKQKK